MGKTRENRIEAAVSSAADLYHLAAEIDRLRKQVRPVCRVRRPVPWQLIHTHTLVRAFRSGQGMFTDGSLVEWLTIASCRPSFWAVEDFGIEIQAHYNSEIPGMFEDGLRPPLTRQKVWEIFIKGKKTGDIADYEGRQFQVLISGNTESPDNYWSVTIVPAGSIDFTGYCADIKSLLAMSSVR